MLLEKIKADHVQHLKTGDAIKRNILSVILSECDLLRARNNEINDERVIKVLKDTVNNIELSLSYQTSDSMKAKLLEEKNTLLSYVPDEVSDETVLDLLSEIKAPILEAKNNGMAIGLAMKHLKNKGILFSSNSVIKCVENIRC